MTPHGPRNPQNPKGPDSSPPWALSATLPGMNPYASPDAPVPPPWIRKRDWVAIVLLIAVLAGLLSVPEREYVPGVGVEEYERGREAFVRENAGK